MVAIRGHTWRICVNWRRKRRQRSAVHRAKRINDGVPFTLSLLSGEQNRQNRDWRVLDRRNTREGQLGALDWLQKKYNKLQVSEPPAPSQNEFPM